MSLFMGGVAKEGHTKLSTRSGRELNTGPSGWYSEILPTALMCGRGRGLKKCLSLWRLSKPAKLASLPRFVILQFVGGWSSVTEHSSQGFVHMQSKHILQRNVQLLSNE